jgi:hypothetical protein
VALAAALLLTACDNLPIPGVTPRCGKGRECDGNLPALAPFEDASRTDRKVFATYLPWFEVAPSWTHWKWQDHDPEVVTSGGRRQIAAARYPAIGPYDSRDDAVLGYHLLLLRAAGFDGAFVNWYGRGNRIDEAARALFDKVDAWRAAFGLRFSLALMLDAQPYLGKASAAQVDELTGDLREVLASYAGRASYQRFEGKPLLLWFPKPEASGNQTISAAEFKLAAEAQTAPFVLSYENPDPDYKLVAGSVYGWIEGVNGGGTDFGAKYLDWLYPTFSYQRKQGWTLPLAIGIAYPGFDDAGVYAWTGDRASRRHIDRTIGGKATLDLTWDYYEAAVATGSASPWLQVATFNDWNEGSEIEPSQELGSMPIAHTARRIAGFKGGQASPPEAWAFAAKFFENRRSGASEAAMRSSLALFFAGSYGEAALSLNR